MRFKIHWAPHTEDDCVIVEGETIEEIRDKANEALKERGLGVDDEPWSEELA